MGYAGKARQYIANKRAVKLSDRKDTKRTGGERQSYYVRKVEARKQTGNNARWKRILIHKNHPRSKRKMEHVR